MPIFAQPGAPVKKIQPLRLGLASAVALCLAMSACSTQAWYEGMKARARNECYQRAPGEQQNCLEKVNKQSYDQYEKERAPAHTAPKP
jgi:hypothetical protein